MASTGVPRSVDVTLFYSSPGTRCNAPRRSRHVGAQAQHDVVIASDQTLRERAGSALAYCLRREHLRRTLTISLVVGVVLTLINQGGVILGGDATVATWVRCGLNFLVPFCVSNAGLLSARR
jgi:hypothetical protein